MWRTISQRWSTSAPFRVSIWILAVVLVFQILARTISLPGFGSLFGPRREVVVNTSINPAEFGERIVITASVSDDKDMSKVPPGQVSFYDGSKLIGETDLRGGRASIDSDSLALGIHHVTALYYPSTGERPSGTNHPLVLRIDEPRDDGVTTKDPERAGKGKKPDKSPAVPPDKPVAIPENVVGLWGRSKGGREPIAEHEVEFSANGTGRIVWNRRKSDEITYEYHPNPDSDKEGTLRLFKTNPRTGGSDFLESGRVRWLPSGRHFMYTVEETSSSMNSRGWEYSYVRKPNPSR